jgi:hypothetical protein
MKIAPTSSFACRSLSLFALVNGLPDVVEWAVVFRADSLFRQISTQQLGAMLGFPAGTEIQECVAVALTSLGKALAFDAPEPLLTPWIWPSHEPRGEPGETVAGRLARRLALLAGMENADCIAFGQLPGSSPVVMALTIDGAGVATAEALFDQRPPQRGYDLLPAVGVHPHGGEWRHGYWCARFSNRLGDHLLSAELAGFSRTANCNLFFLHHGRVDDRLEAGLLAAAAARIQHGLRTAAASAVDLVLTARRAQLAMTCVPPAPRSAYPCGDVVPLGLLAYALGSIPNSAPAVKAASALADRFLDTHRVGNLWPFHHGGLPTATDSALVLLGQKITQKIEALEEFSDGGGGYLPQLSSDQGDALHMRREHATQHWRQPDFVTTCLVRGLRRSAGLVPSTPLAWLAERFERRAGLFFANPYLVDWALALAIAGDADAAHLRNALSVEILSSRNPDGSFGRFDSALSTAAAIVALAALGHRSRAICVAQLQLLRWLEAQGHGSATTPFFSSRSLPIDATHGVLRGRGILAVGKRWHALSLYEDTHRMVLDAFVILALQAPCDPAEDPSDPVPVPHPRYLAASPSVYIEGFALPPYVESRA